VFILFRANISPLLDLLLADYDALRALDADNSPRAHSMSEEEINTLPVFKYKFQAQQASPAARKRQDELSFLGALWQKKNDYKCLLSSICNPINYSTIGACPTEFLREISNEQYISSCF
jgi:hypothetical protein